MTTPDPRLTPHTDPDHGDEHAGVYPGDDGPGSANTPLGSDHPSAPDDAAGRVAPGEAPSPGANQGKVEPMSPHGDRSDVAPPNTGAEGPEAGPEAGTVGSGDPTSAQAGRGVAGGRVGGEDVRPTGAPSSSGTPEPTGPTGPTGRGGRGGQETAGHASRVPGDLGESANPVHTDTVAGARRARPGQPPASVPAPDTPGGDHGVPTGPDHAMGGTSEQSAVVHGTRTMARGPDLSPPPAEVRDGETAPMPEPDPSRAGRLPPDTRTNAGLRSGHAAHASREGGPATGEESIVGRQSAPDGEVGST